MALSGRTVTLLVSAFFVVAPSAPAQEPAEPPDWAVRMIRSYVNRDAAERASLRVERLAELPFPDLEAACRAALAREPDPSELGAVRLRIPDGPTVDAYFPEPAAGERFPLVIAFHGHGGDGANYLRVWYVRENIIPEQRPVWRQAEAQHIAVIAPTDESGDWPPERDAEVLAALRRVSLRYPIDRNRVFTDGLSSGAEGALRFAYRHPDEVAGVIARAGYTFEAGLLGNARTVPTFILQGDSDPVCPVRMAREFRDRLADAGVPCVYREVAGGGHEPFVRMNPDVGTWMRGVSRDPMPRTFSVRTPGPGRHRVFWVEVEAERAVRVNAAIEGNEVRITPEGAVTRLTLLVPEGLLDLGQSVRVLVSGEVRFEGRVARDPAFLLDGLAETADPCRLSAAGIDVTPP